MMRVGLEVIRKDCDLGIMFTLRTGTLLCCTHSSSKNEYESIETHQSLLKSYTEEKSWEFTVNDEARRVEGLY